ncbi:MAG: hypothetical protein ABT01_07445 [Clostridium sp. SCN 57-10]|nr:MAG: hypothetical protein ABT01_07445 [Clostridium sp. SCN 57-10]
MKRRLYKNDQNRQIAGVCSGIAEFFGMPAWLVRVIWLLLALNYGIGVWAYIICAIVMPSKAQVMAEQAREENRGFGAPKSPFEGEGFDTTDATDVDTHPADEPRVYDMPPKKEREYEPVRDPFAGMDRPPKQEDPFADVGRDDPFSSSPKNGVYDEAEFYRQSRKTKDEDFK